jgi:hypothetical protein
MSLESLLERLKAEVETEAECGFQGGFANPAAAVRAQRAVSDDEIDAICQVFGIEPPKATPALVRCCDCASFVADAIGDGFGIGRCATDGEGARPQGRWKVRPDLWARGERRCGDYREVAI